MRLIDADPLIEEIASIYGFSISSVRCSLVGSVIANAPTINIPHSDDWEKYSDKLWKNAYERGKADRPQGKWIRDRYWSRGIGMGEEYGFFYKCSLCEYEVENGYTRCGFNFCPYCGADMRGADDDL